MKSIELDYDNDGLLLAEYIKLSQQNIMQCRKNYTKFFDRSNEIFGNYKLYEARERKFFFV